MRLFSLALVFAAAACNTADPMKAVTSTLPRIEVTTDGGISGRGLGSVTIDAGTATAAGFTGTCSTDVTAQEREQLLGALKTFASITRNDVHPDQIRYMITAGDRTASWYGENPPESAAALFHVAWQIRQRALGSCR